MKSSALSMDSIGHYLATGSEDGLVIVWVYDARRKSELVLSRTEAKGQ